MQQLHLVGFTADNRGLIFSPRKGSKSGGFVVTLDDKLIARVDEIVARRDADEQDSRSSSGPHSSLSPREIQARLRAGRTIPQVAREAGVEEEWVARWAAPILAEQGKVVEQAQELILEKNRIGPSAVPLGEAVRWNMADKGIVFTDAGWSGSWDAFHLRANAWMVRFTYVYRRKTQQAEWEVDTRDATVISRNRQGTELGFVAPGRRRPKMPRSMLTAVDLPSPPTVAAQEPAAAKRATKKRSARRKPARKKSAAKKRPATKPAAKTARKKSPAKRAAKKAVSKATSRRAPAKKSPARKPAARKAAARKAPTKKASKKAPRRKAPARKSTAKKTAPRRSAAKKAGPRKAKARPPAVTPTIAAASNRVVPTPLRVAPRRVTPTPTARPSRTPHPRATTRPRPAPTAASPSRPRRASAAARRPEPRRPLDVAEPAAFSDLPDHPEPPAREMETLPRPQVRAPIRIDSGVPRRPESSGPPIIRADRADQSREEPVGVGGRSAEPSAERQGRFRFRRGRGRT